MRITTACLLVLLCSFSAEAQTTKECTQAASQTTPCTVTVGKAFSVIFDQPNTEFVSHFRVFINGSPVGVNLPLAQLQAGTMTVGSLVIAAKGAYTLTVASANADNVFEHSPAVKLNAVLGVPTAPGNLRILTIEATIAENGAISLRLVEEAPK